MCNVFASEEESDVATAGIRKGNVVLFPFFCGHAIMKLRIAREIRPCSVFLLFILVCGSYVVCLTGHGSPSRARQAELPNPGEPGHVPSDRSWLAESCSPSRIAEPGQAEPAGRATFNLIPPSVS